MSSAKPDFDPTQPFTTVSKPAFNPNQPFQETDTGLPSINAPTDNSSASPLLDTIASANPITDLANTLSKKPAVRHFVNDTAVQTAGEAAGTVVLPGAGSVVGAGIGNAAAKIVNDVEDDPDLAKRAAQYIFSDPQHTQLIQDLMGSDPDKAAQYVRSLGIPLLQRFSTGAIFQLLGEGISSVAGKAVDSMQGSALDVGSKTSDAIPQGVANAPGTPFIGPPETGVTLNPDQVTNSKVADVLDKSARTGLLSGDKMRSFDAANVDALKQAQQKIATDLSGGLTEYIPRTQLADYITSSNDVGQKIQKAVQDNLYQKADEALGGDLVPVPEKAPGGIIDPKTGQPTMIPTGNITYKRVGGITVPTAQIKDLAQLELTKSELINGIGNAEQLGPLLSRIKTLDSGVNFSDMQNLRSQILDMNRDATGAGAKRILTGFAKSINDTMESTAKTLSPDGYKQWFQANQFYKHGVQTFQNDAVAKLITNDYRMADNLGNFMYKNGNVTQIQQLKTIANRVDNLVNNPVFKGQLKEIMDANPRLQGTLQPKELTYPAIMNKYKRGYMQEMFDAYAPKSIDPTNPAQSPLNFQGLVGELQHPEAVQTMKELFKPEEISRLQKFATIGAAAMKHNGQGMTHAIGMVTRLTGLATGKWAAKMLTNPESADMLMNGVSRLGSKQVGAVKQGSEFLLRAANAIMDRGTENDEGN